MSHRTYRITEASHAEDQWYIAVKRWGLWWTIDVRTGIDRAAEYVRRAKIDDALDAALRKFVRHGS